MQDRDPDRVQVGDVGIVPGNVVLVTRSPAGSAVRTAVRGCNSVDPVSDALVVADAICEGPNPMSRSEYRRWGLSVDVGIRGASAADDSLRTPIKARRSALTPRIPGLPSRLSLLS